MNDSAPASANHAYQASLTSQDSSGTNSARPNASPQPNDPRRLRPASATTSRAGPSTASGQAPTGGKEAYKTRPPATEMSSAHRMPKPLESAARPVCVAVGGDGLGGDHPGSLTGGRAHAARLVWPGRTGGGLLSGAPPGSTRPFGSLTRQPGSGNGPGRTG